MTSTTPPVECLHCGDDIADRNDQRSLGTTSSGAPRWIRYHRGCYADWQRDDRRQRAAGLRAYKDLLALDDDALILARVHAAQAEQDAA